MSEKSIKLKFREEKCNIVEMTKDKVACIPTGTKILQPLQSDEDFERLADTPNWAVTQTVDSNILFFDLDLNEYDKLLNQFFNRIRDKYINHSEHIHSKHGFLKVVDATHEWCVDFARKYNNMCGIEIYAEKHWVIFGGNYHNDKNLDDPKRTTEWFRIDDLHIEPIINVTKTDLGNVFSVIPQHPLLKLALFPLIHLQFLWNK